MKKFYFIFLSHSFHSTHSNIEKKEEEILYLSAFRNKILMIIIICFFCVPTATITTKNNVYQLLDYIVVKIFFN